MADNWYVVLELDIDPPEENEQIISDKIDERLKYWSAHFNDFKMGAQYRSWLQNVPQIKKDMLGPKNIRKQLAAEACTIVYEPVDKLLKTIGRKGNITNDEGEKLARKLKISLDIVKKRAKAFGIQWIEGTSSDFQVVYDKYYRVKPQNAAVYEGMKKMLSAFGVDSLYDFLYMNTTAKRVNQLPCETLRLRAAEKKQNEFYKNDNISGTGSKLCGQCNITFADEKSKEAYDKYLEYIKRKEILDNAKSIAEISGELAAEQSDDIVGQLIQVFRDRKLAEEVFTAFCKIEKIVYNSGISLEKSADLKVCRCGYINDVSDGRRVCGNCGLELVIKCPRCGAENESNIKVCKCGFKFENIDKALAFYEQAEQAIDSLDFAVAKARLCDADHYWPDNEKGNALRKRLDEYENRVGTDVVHLRKAIENKRYCEAETHYQNIQKLFPNYTNITIKKEIDNAIKRARMLYKQAQAAKSDNSILELCTKAYDLCADFPGIRELIPVPGSVSGFKVLTNGLTRTNTIFWETIGDRSVKYVVVKSTNGWIQNLSDGHIIFSGSASSFADQDIEAGRPYFYNVFAERAGIYSKGAEGDFKEAVNLFEIRQVALTAGNSSLKISWDRLPDNATVEIYEIQDNGAEYHIASSSASSYLLTNLKNDRLYEYRVSLSYCVIGKKLETKGINISGRPTCPPLPIDTLRVAPSQAGQYEATWYKINGGEVRLYGSVNRPPYIVGETISISEIEQRMSQLQQKNLSAHTMSNLKREETGASFEYLGTETLYVVAVVVKAGTTVFGNIVRVGKGETVTVKSVSPVNGKINIYLDPPENATGFVILHRNDQFPKGLGDVNAIRRYVPLKQYQLDSAVVLDILDEQKYFFTVFAEFKQDGEKDYSVGTEYLFDNSTKLIISYSISVSRKLFGESSVVIEFEANCREFILPEIEIMSSVGNTPMFKTSARLFYSVPSQAVNGSLQVKIPIPKNMPGETYIKAFFRDDSAQSRNQLRLKLKSNYKIS